MQSIHKIKSELLEIFHEFIKKVNFEVTKIFAAISYLENIYSELLNMSYTDAYKKCFDFSYYKLLISLIIPPDLLQNIKFSKLNNELLNTSNQILNTLNDFKNFIDSDFIFKSVNHLINNSKTSFESIKGSILHSKLECNKGNTISSELIFYPDSQKFKIIDIQRNKLKELKISKEINCAIGSCACKYNDCSYFYCINKDAFLLNLVNDKKDNLLKPISSYTHRGCTKKASTIYLFGGISLFRYEW